MRNRKAFKPNLIVVAGDAKLDPMTSKVISRLPNAEVIFTDDNADIGSLEQGVLINYFKNRAPNSLIEELSDAEIYSEAKNILILKRHKGKWMKSCPGTSSHVCCNLFIVDPGEGCPLDCTYCYLQSYLKKNPTLKLYTNTYDLLNELAEKFIKEPGRLFRVGTGELIDSLVWDDLTDFTKEIVPFFAKFSNAVLELKSKDDFVQNLEELADQHLGKTVVSWSMNADTINKSDEAKTASINERLVAAQAVIKAGYRVGFHLDPIVYFKGWEKEYTDLVSNIFSKIAVKDIAWVSVSTLRYQSNLQDMMIKRFPESKLPYGEQFMAKDSKLRYVQPIRFKLTRFVWDLIKEKSPDLAVYMCMESSTAWKEISGGLPVAGNELKEIFARRASLPVIS
jgi:spore photoproduct lyase